MQSTEDITKQLAAMADWIEQLSKQDHGVVAMILFTLVTTLGTREGRERVTQMMLDLSSSLVT